MFVNSPYRAVLWAVVVSAAVATSATAMAQDGPFSALRVGANRSQYTGHCPVQIVYTANIDFVMPHPQGFVFNYHWERTDGGKTATQVVRPPPGQGRVILRETWQLGAPGQHYDAGMTLFVNSGNTHLSQSSQAVAVNCR